MKEAGFCPRLVSMTAGVFAALLLAAPAGAAPIFFDDFENDLSKWTPSNGQIVADPLDASNNVLNFSQVDSFGDIFTSTPINLVAGRKYEVSFDFYGLKGSDTGSGGYAGLSDGTPGHHAWYAGTAPVSTNLPGSLVLQDDVGSWTTYSYVFTAPIELQGSATSAVRLMFEDFSASGPTPGNAWFDNVALNLVPLPAALPLYGAGIAGLGLFGWLRRRKVIAVA